MAASRKKLAAEAWGALLQVHAALVPELDRELRRQAGLPLAWYDVLLELHSAPDHRLTMSELGDRVVLSRSRVSRVVDELAREGLVARVANPADARSAYAVLSAVGEQRFLEAAPVYVRGIERSFAAGLSEAELRTITSALHRVRERL
ncbi:MarR family winged helix-turn-helix transcriptional regulator [Nocardioides cynanchi]|uniref:MarR family winged helix-turn-helix transcriptional regulator n=1 Tax=Nocardioides cynanchi TaxID=2558918 RepID=UPI001243AB76|nr:MarR family transcriptional regulator [Nocardioides cynanchi]